jgi:asparagine synthase (glutamine-hydrolysing)
VFADYVLGLPLDLKLHNFTRKYIFREALRGRLPDEILMRKKHGFGMPVSKWLRGDLRELAGDLLSEDRLRRDGLFEPAYVQQLLANHLAGRQDNRKPLWTLLVFQLWHDRYIAGGVDDLAELPALTGVSSVSTGA